MSSPIAHAPAAARLPQGAPGSPPPHAVVRRTCSCGQHTGGGECVECRRRGEQLQRHAATGPAPPDHRHGAPWAPGGSAFSHDFARVPAHSPFAAVLRPGLEISQPGDPLEREAEHAADRVMRMPAPSGPVAAVAPPLAAPAPTPGPSGGIPLSAPLNSFMAPRFGADFSAVRLHADADAARMSRAVDARAFTLGSHIYFGDGEYRPETAGGRRLIAHELAHVAQQESGLGRTPGPLQSLGAAMAPRIQRTLNDGHDLTSPRFSLLLDLEAAYDDETLIRLGSTGRGVQAIQHALYDLGFPLPAHGADGIFGPETDAAVRAFQAANPPLAVDGVVGPRTMAALDARFGGPAPRPPAATLSATWTEACILDVLCPWSPHTIDVLRNRITLKSFDDISWADEEWDGSSWIPAPFAGGGYNTGSEIGVLNTSCEGIAETLYHEVLHAEQPTAQTTTLERESYAYRIGEEFSIAMGLGGRPSLRSTDAQGREFADPALVGAFVASQYPSVPSGGGGDQIIGQAATDGHVEVRRPDGTIYTRPAAIGEKVPGPMTVTNETTHSTAAWTCP